MVLFLVSCGMLPLKAPECCWTGRSRRTGPGVFALHLAFDDRLRCQTKHSKHKWLKFVISPSWVLKQAAQNHMPYIIYQNKIRRLVLSQKKISDNKARQFITIIWINYPTQALPKLGDLPYSIIGFTQESLAKGLCKKKRENSNSDPHSNQTWSWNVTRDAAWCKSCNSSCSDFILTEALFGKSNAIDHLTQWGENMKGLFIGHKLAVHMGCIPNIIYLFNLYL